MVETGSPTYVAIVVSVDAPGLSQPFTYSLPAGVAVRVGDAVVAPFGSTGDQIGYVVGVDVALPDGLAPAKVKNISAVIEGATAFDSGLWETAEWVARQTLCELRDVVKLVAPEPTSARIRTTLRLVGDWHDAVQGMRTAGVLELIERFEEAGDDGIDADTLSRTGDEIAKALAALRRKKLIALSKTVLAPETKEKTVRVLRLCAEPDVAAMEADRLETRSARQAKLLRELITAEQTGGALPITGLFIDAANRPAAKALADKGLAVYHEINVRRDPFAMQSLRRTTAPPLNDEQSVAAKAIAKAFDDGSKKPILLYGVTGSGKTEVYLDAIAHVRRAGRGALLLLPEIALSAQVLDLLKARFGDDVAVLHSALSAGERFDEWRRIQRGEAPIVVGARSAVFAPVVNLGLVIMDEEHEASYKQDSAPRYHARDVALFRAKQSGAIAVLGSATPAVESYFRAKIGVYDLLTLTKRVSDRPLPEVKLVDLRRPPDRRRKRKEAEQGDGATDTKQGEAATENDGANLSNVLSIELREALGERLARGEQAIFFLNRRGFSPFLLCRDCGFAFRCGNCDVTLTYHRAQRLLQCHHCDFRRPAPDACPRCGGMKVHPFGIGTEKVEDAVREAFPECRTLRMDRDTTERKGSHASILRTFRRHEADVLIGTQMVAKGLDFPSVTLVGVINADTGLNMPDFHACERTFQLLAQVSGRAGRGERPGEVYVQTFDPAHESIVLASKHDYEGFYYQEIVQRRDLRYPPFARLANVVATDEDEPRAIERCERLAQRLRAAIVNAGDDSEAQILGPVACPLARVRNRFRWHLMLRCATRPALLALLTTALAALTATDRAGLTVDIDPTTML